MTNDQLDHEHRSTRVNMPDAEVIVPAATRALVAPSRHIGRIGALAVALGIGLAIANNPAVALADSTGSESAGGSASDSSTSGGSTPNAGGSHSDSDSPPSTTPDGGRTNNAESDEPGDDATVTDSPDADTEDDLAPGRPGKGNPTSKPRSGDRTSIIQGSTDADGPTSSSGRTTAKASVLTTKDSGSPNAADRLAAQVTSSTTPRTTVSTSALTADSVAPSVTPQNPIAAVLTSAVQAITGLSQRANSPVAPPTSPTLWAILGWVRRELQYTLFNAGPKINYHAAENTQVTNGVVVGSLNPTDADGDKLTVTVTSGPTKGTLMMNQDGTFTYVPTTKRDVFTGYTDTFQVTVDDRPGNPPHVNLGALFSPNWGATITKTITVTVNPSSPLGTPDEIAAEKKAAEIIATPAVQAALVTFRTNVLNAANARFAGGVDAENLALLDQAVNEFAMAAALQAQATDPTNPKVIEYLIPPHTWYGQTVEGSRVVFDNPDTLYRIIAVNSLSSYVIHGQFLGGKPVDANFSVGAPGGATVANLNIRDLVVEADGTFTIYADDRTPDTVGLPPNHLTLTPTANQILIRDTFSDWNAQTPMSLSVERIAGPAANPSPALADLSARTVAALNQGGAAFGLFIGQATTSPNPVPGQPAIPKPPNTFLPIGTGGSQTLTTQLQTFGNFKLADDQALVITVNPGKAGYFVVPVTNDWATTTNFWDQQTSLNNAQAVPNADGSYTIVVSPTDPGVANWVSTGGLNQGTFQIRFQALDTTSSVTPTLSTTVVTLDQLNTVLPTETQYVTADQRAEQIAKRKAGYNSRFAPFLQV
jgi:Bacterial Ig domain